MVLSQLRTHDPAPLTAGGEQFQISLALKWISVGEIPLIRFEMDFGRRNTTDPNGTLETT
ncbi:hypothetical protein N7449_009383 [Penicillium cf. viridicatum]|uniref:Uncharacterized protein n=1 Tax=Penicillium cf. viridicatum TaxID=2972119 RepID=A0A9W9M801_9EURO|nr:hypothetical protein N7449_009383 [Penicillium cf. viridicatum]